MTVDPADIVDFFLDHGPDAWRGTTPVPDELKRIVVNASWEELVVAAFQVIDRIGDYEHRVERLRAGLEYLSLVQEGRRPR